MEFLRGLLLSYFIIMFEIEGNLYVCYLKAMLGNENRVFLIEFALVVNTDESLEMDRGKFLNPARILMY